MIDLAVATHRSGRKRLHLAIFASTFICFSIRCTLSGYRDPYLAAPVSHTLAHAYLRAAGEVHSGRTLTHRQHAKHWNLLFLSSVFFYLPSSLPFFFFLLFFFSSFSLHVSNLFFECSRFCFVICFVLCLRWDMSALFHLFDVSSCLCFSFLTFELYQKKK